MPPFQNFDFILTNIALSRDMNYSIPAVSWFVLTISNTIIIHQPGYKTCWLISTNDSGDFFLRMMLYFSTWASSANTIHAIAYTMQLCIHIDTSPSKYCVRFFKFKILTEFEKTILDNYFSIADVLGCFYFDVSLIGCAIVQTSRTMWKCLASIFDGTYWNHVY